MSLCFEEFHGLYFCSRRPLWKVSLGHTCITSFMHEMLYVCIPELSKERSETGGWWLQAGRHQSGSHQWWQQSPKLVKNLNQFVKNSDSSPKMRHCKAIVTYMGFVAVNVFDLWYLNSFFSIIYQLLHLGENFLHSESSTQIHIQQANHLYKFADSVTNGLVFHGTQPLSFPAPEPCVDHKKRSFPTWHSWKFEQALISQASLLNT